MDEQIMCQQQGDSLEISEAFLAFVSVETGLTTDEVRASYLRAHELTGCTPVEYLAFNMYAVGEDACAARYATRKKSQGNRNAAAAKLMASEGITEAQAKSALRDAYARLKVRYADFAKYGFYGKSPEEQKELAAQLPELKAARKASAAAAGTSSSSAALQGAVEVPYGTKISNYFKEGVEFYWKPLENVTGYEVYRKYALTGKYELIGKVPQRNLHTFIDTEFDREKTKVYYSVRGYVEEPDGQVRRSSLAKVRAASFRKELVIDRAETYLYAGTQRSLRALYGWGEPDNAVWQSSDESVARISQDGVIEALQKGTCTITCSVPAIGQSATARVEVDRGAEAPLGSGSRRFAFDAQSGYWRNAVAQNADSAVIMMVGDLMCGSNQMRTQRTAAGGMCFNDTFDYVKHVTSESDLAICNLETLLAPGWPYMLDEAYINNMNNCNATPRYLDAVRYGGFDVLAVANNHNCDGGIRALQETLQNIESYDFPYTGMFRDAAQQRYCLVDVNGIKVAVLAYMLAQTGFNGKDASWTPEEQDVFLNVFSPERAQADIAACKAAGAEYVIAYMHWGFKNHRKTARSQREAARAVARAGADYIVGSNPHVLQAYELIQAEDGRLVPCFYSVGNFQAVMDQIPGNRDSVMVRIRLERAGNGSVVLAENNYLPFHTYTEFRGSHWAPIYLSDATAKPESEKAKADRREDIMRAIGVNIMPYNACDGTDDRLRERGKAGLLEGELAAIYSTMENTGWSFHFARMRVEEAYRAGVPFSVYTSLHRYRSFQSDQVNVLKTVIACHETGDAKGASQGLSLYEADNDKNNYEDMLSCADERRSAAMASIKTGKLTVGVLCDYLGVSLPSALAEKADLPISVATTRRRPTSDFVYFTTQKKISASVLDWLIARKAVAVVGFASAKAKSLEDAGIPFIECAAPRSMFTDIVSLIRLGLGIPMVCISGSIGKTSTREMIELAVSSSHKIFCPGYHNEFRVIGHYLQLVPEETEVYIQEASGARLMQAECNARMVRPDYFVLTNVGTSHIENYDGDQKRLLYGKLAFDRNAADGAIGIINWDDPLLKKAAYAHPVVSFAMQDESADFFADNVIEENGKVLFEVRERDGRATPVTINAVGVHNVMNALAAFALGVQMGISRKALVKAVGEYAPRGFRQNLVDLAGCRAYLDCYNASEQSIQSAIQTMKTISVPEGGKKIVVLADIAELGPKTEECHRNVGDIVVQSKTIDTALFFGQNMKIAANRASGSGIDVRHTTDREQLLTWLREVVNPGDLVAFKGSHSMGLATVVDDFFETDFFTSDEDGMNGVCTSVSQDSFKARDASNYGLVLMSGPKKRANLQVPSQIGEAKLRIVAEGAFAGASATSVELPSPLRAIGERAFYGCAKLERVTLPSSLRYIGREAFASCGNLKSVVVPEGVHTIAPRAFAGCASLQEVVLPESLLTMADDAFEGCPNVSIRK